MSSQAAGSRRTPRYLDVADRIWPATRRFMGAHTFLYKHTGGRIGHTIPGVPGKMLLLDHVGAKSGTKRTSPLLYVRDGEDLVIVASKGGFPKNPAWFHNLMANPDTAVQVKGEDHPGPRPGGETGGAGPPLGDGRQGLPRLRGLRDPQQRPRNPARRPRAALAGAAHFGLRSSATGSPLSSAIACGGQGPAQLSRAPSIVIVVPEKKSPAGEAR